jgi:hypothetical protein
MIMSVSPSGIQHDRGGDGDGGDGGGRGGGDGSPYGHGALGNANDRSESDRWSKIKEAESICLPKFPKSAAGFGSWQDNVIDRVVAPSGQSSDSFAWICQVEDTRVSFDYLGIPGEIYGRSWESIDDKICAAMSENNEGELGKILFRKCEEMKSGRKLIRGRQMLRLVYQFFQANENRRQVYGLKGLSSVHLKADDLESFSNIWLKVLNGQRNPHGITHVQKEELFFLQVTWISSL